MNEELMDMILFGQETRNTEYRGQESWTDALTQEAIVKSILAMSNTPDGGIIVLGVKKELGHIQPLGLTIEQFQAFNQESVQAVVDKYAMSDLNVTVMPVIAEESHFVMIQVDEFNQTPVICRKNGKILREGILYTRSSENGQTKEVTTALEMQEILERAIEKGIRSFQKHVQSSGLEEMAEQAREKLFETSKDYFSKQLGAL